MAQLLGSDTRTADANGKAVCQVQPLRAFEWWHITNTSISSTSTKIPSCKLYRGSEAPSSFLEGTYTATFNSTTDPIDLQNGERLLAVFEGATPGAQCTLTVTGDKKGR